MNPTATRSSFLTRLAIRWGGHYLWRVTLAFQLASLLAASLGIYYIVLNAGLNEGQFARLADAVFGLVGVANLLVFLYGLGITPQARARLIEWAQAQKAKTALAPQPQQEERAWREITAYPWRFTRFSVLISFFQVIVPAALYLYWTGGFSLSQSIHVLIGGVISASGLVLFYYFALEWALLPIRMALLPSDAGRQHSGLSGAPLQSRMLMVFLAIGMTALLMISALAYQKASDLIVPGADTSAILRSLQNQLAGVGLVAVAFTIGFSFLLARSVSTPINRLREAMSNVERGQSNQRAEVISADEIGHLDIAFNRMIAHLDELQGNLEKQVTSRTTQLQAVNEVGRAAASTLDPDKLITITVNLITERFGYYYAALFLIDPSRKWAELKDASGEAGRVLRESHHRLEVGNKSMVGAAIENRQARIALDVGAESVRFDNPILPYTHSEIALPLIAGEHVLGALDVQSTKQSAFGAQDIETLQNMANQVAIALENARLFQETRERLQEVQTVQRQYLREAWISQATQENIKYGVGDETVSEHQTALNVPLALRDQIIGQITLTGDAEWSPEERIWVESIATQTAIALENARLMEASRDQASIERTVAEITARVWSANTIDGILQTAAKEIGRALNLSEATIELHSEEEGAISDE